MTCAWAFYRSVLGLLQPLECERELLLGALGHEVQPVEFALHDRDLRGQLPDLGGELVLRLIGIVDLLVGRVRRRVRDRRDRAPR